MHARSIPLVEGLGNRVAQAKYDGWRCMVIKDTTGTYLPSNKKRGKDGCLFFVSRRDVAKGGPTDIPVSEEIVQFVEDLNLPDQTVLDTEWMARRTIGECPERLYVFDVLWWANAWEGNNPYSTRFGIVTSLIKTEDKADDDLVQLPLQVTENFEDFFESLKDKPYTEGMVIKPLDYTLKGSRTECVKNANMVKIKWRDGASGRDVFHVKAS